MRLTIAWVLALSTLTVAHANETDQANVRRADPPRVISDFELTDQFAKLRKFSSFRGAPVLVFFGFASCPDVCPAAMNNLRMLMQSKDEDVRRAKVLVISVDGARDTPAVMKDYLEAFSKDFVGMTGSPVTVRNIAAQFPAVFFKGAADKSGAYLVDHTSQIYLVDAEGKLRATFFNASVETMREVVGEIAREER